MSIDLKVLSRDLDPKDTILIFGAGASIPSGAPSTWEVIKSLGENFKINDYEKYSLSDIATIIEAKFNRKQLIEALQRQMLKLLPQKGILNIAEYEWAGIYTTNYDTLVEQCYHRADKPLAVRSSNFDFGVTEDPTTTHLYKLHGTIEQDVSLGHQTRMIITAGDYDKTDDYRQTLHSRFAEQLVTKNSIIIGQSLEDPDLKRLVDIAVESKKNQGAPGKLSLLCYEVNEDRALIYEAKGLEVCFGGIDDFFSEIATKMASVVLLPGFSEDPLDHAKSLKPATYDVKTRRVSEEGNLDRMFNGGAASYADILRGWTFERTFSDRLEAQLSNDAQNRIAVVMGSAGTGKTTGVRKALIRINDRDLFCWEHDSEFALQSSEWAKIDAEIRKRNQAGVLFIDNADEHLLEINSLLDIIMENDVPALKLVLSSSKPRWNPRFKSPYLYNAATGYELNQLDENEIESLLDMLESGSDISALIEKEFKGFNKPERRRRLTDRCKADMFVCMRNIFDTDAFDDIILREYAGLRDDYQEIYKKIAGMEASGIRVHRQLVLRTTSIPSGKINTMLDDLAGLISERTVSERDGIYAWNVRHGVIADIISKYKFSDGGEFFEFVSSIIDNLNASYDIELRSMDDICSRDGAFSRITDRNQQNILLRKMISLAPRRRVPRHRLVDNLIKQGNHDKANTEIRLFEEEMRTDGPLHRYKVLLLLHRARNSPGILPEDRYSLALQAASIAEAGVDRFRDNRYMYDCYLQCGVVSYKYSNDLTVFNEAMDRTKATYDRISDPDLLRVIRKYERIESTFP